MVSVSADFTAPPLKTTRVLSVAWAGRGRSTSAKRSAKRCKAYVAICTSVLIAKAELIELADDRQRALVKHIQQIESRHVGPVARASSWVHRGA
jgi:hypothetical protein